MATRYATLATSSIRSTAPLAGGFRSRRVLRFSSSSQNVAFRSSFLDNNASLVSRRREKPLGRLSHGGWRCAPRASVSEFAPLTAAVYGACLLAGGLFAYTRTGSKGSLGGGVTGGVALGVAYFLMQVPETQDLGQAVGFGAAVLFAAIFGIRLASTGKIIPAVPLLGLSAASSLVFALSYLQTRVTLP